ncbi:lipid-A-disaccharide synthase [Nevskia soli]|uniref:lipid-A-disaccharide synthase n=1 Tax=Nevskia soli TaxID=418856 RepID=UPI0004A7523D|nr:lipid-A-disaccharide synthase [Nevskia soli]
MRFALIAGEASGDLLGGALVHALRNRFPEATFYGVTGPRMREAGCDSVDTIDRLSVMGLAEVLPKLPDILRMRGELLRRFEADRPDCVIGIDAPDFNLALEQRLRESGLPTVHVVSPSIWAWKAGRVKKIARAANLVLCLFPFEPRYYEGHPVKAEYIGHPLAEELAEPVSREDARRLLDLPQADPCVAILPGSRGGELKYLAEPFVQTAAWLAQRRPELSFVVPLAKPSLRPLFEQAIAAHAPQLRWKLVDGRSREAMRAADVVLLASGTATLECLLLDRPMVVSYRASALTAWLVRKLIKIDRVSLPNLLCQEPVVPEYLQEEADVAHLGPAVLELLDQPAARARQTGQFAAVRQELRRGAADSAAAAIARLIGR